jgi:hypothetical protein
LRPESRWDGFELMQKKRTSGKLNEHTAHGMRRIRCIIVLLSCIWHKRAFGGKEPVCSSKPLTIMYANYILQFGISCTCMRKRPQIQPERNLLP